MSQRPTLSAKRIESRTSNILIENVILPDGSVDELLARLIDNQHLPLRRSHQLVTGTSTMFFGLHTSPRAVRRTVFRMTIDTSDVNSMAQKEICRMIRDILSR